MNLSNFARNSKNQLIITAVLFALWAFFALRALQTALLPTPMGPPTKTSRFTASSSSSAPGE